MLSSVFVIPGTMSTMFAFPLASIKSSASLLAGAFPPVGSPNILLDFRPVNLKGFPSRPQCEVAPESCIPDAILPSMTSFFYFFFLLFAYSPIC